MDPAAALEAVERVGVPIAILAAGVFLLWRLGGRLLRALVESYSARISALEADRDHFRDRSEAADDRMNGLCTSMIDVLRKEGRGDGC